MATAIMTFTDTEDEQVDISISFDKAVEKDEDITPAMVTAMQCYSDYTGFDEEELSEEEYLQGCVQEIDNFVSTCSFRDNSRMLVVPVEDFRNFMNRYESIFKIKLQSLMDGLEIPPAFSSQSPSLFHKMGIAIATQAKLAHGAPQSREEQREMYEGEDETNG